MNGSIRTQNVSLENRFSGQRPLPYRYLVDFDEAITAFAHGDMKPINDHSMPVSAAMCAISRSAVQGSEVIAEDTRLLFDHFADPLPVGFFGLGWHTGF